MKRTTQLRKVGNNIPALKGQRKNKNKFHELKLQRLQKKQEQMEAEINTNNAEIVSLKQQNQTDPTLDDVNPDLYDSAGDRS